MKKIYFFIIALIMIPVSVVNSQPSVIWNKIYSTNLQDSAVAITSNNNQGIFITAWSIGAGTYNDIVTLKYDFATGDLLWANRYATALDERPAAIVADNNYVYVTGWGVRNTTLRDMITIKYNASTGDTVFVRYYNNSAGGEYGRSIDIDNAGNIYVTGRSDVGGAQKFTTIKYDPSGNQLWVSIYTGQYSSSFDDAFIIKAEGSGNAVYVTGICNGSIPNTTNILTIKLGGPDGALWWDKRYNGPLNHDDRPCGLALDNSGQYIFVGGYASRPGTVQDFFAIKYNAATSDSVSAIFYAGSTNIEFAYSMAKDNSDNIYLTGFAYVGGMNHFQTVRFNSSLTNVDWHTQTPESDSTVASSIAYDTAGYVWVTGVASSATSGRDYLTIRYNANTGAETWRQKESGPGIANDYATCIISPLADNVIVTGSYVSGGTTGTDIYTIRYADLHGVKPISSEVPNSFNLEQNYPNPFNPVTNIRFDINKSAFVKIAIYDLLGREVAVLVNENLKPGKYETNWNAVNISSGIYFYRMFADDFSATKKMILNK